MSTDSSRVWNFSAGPCCLPVEVLEQCSKDMLNHQGAGMGVMEMSHRSKEFVQIYNQAEKDLRDLLKVPDPYKVMFLQGGATLQFSAIPLNLFGPGSKDKADYVVTGQWSEKAAKEANKYGKANVVFDGKPKKYTHIASVNDWQFSPPNEAAYLHYCMNETVNGVEFQGIPDLGGSAAAGTPLVADMSSNFMTRPIDVAKHRVIYAGAQKNIGPAGNCVVIADPDACSGKTEMGICPTYCSWKTAADAGSMYNTPSCYAIYVTGLFLKWTKEKGSLEHWEEVTLKKSNFIYDLIDSSDNFYSNPVSKPNRSRVNLPFQIRGGDEALEKKFLEEAKKQGLVTLAGHRSVGGIRASLYNGMPMDGVIALAEFMKTFMSENSQ